MQFHRDTLDNGLNVVAEINPRAYSVALGFFVKTGSRDETEDVSGVSHFLEHMAFKGNDRYSAEDVNRIFDEVGAKYNASTSEEVTLYYATVLPEYADRTFDLLTALLYPSLREEDFETEKQVILEEIGMYEDMPAFVAYDNAMRAHFAGHPLSRSILGTTESIEALTSQQMRQYHDQRYKAGNISLIVAGNIERDRILSLAERHCKNWPAGEPSRSTAEALPQGGQSCVGRASSQQQHVTQMAPAPPARSPLRFAADLLSVVVGDSQGSRLYWELVDPGHCEGVELAYNDYDGSGAWMTYLCCRPEQTAGNLGRISEIYDSVNKSGIDDDELEQARNKTASRIVLQSERPMGRLSSLGGNWIYRDEYQSVEDDLRMLQSVTADDVNTLLDKYPLAQTTTVGVGPLEQL
ncbi:MAG: insulinase family protein [Planctomycetota bacterium]|nr:MAG: insulinase family protein [Planctomycetota bacterium]REK29802.1 MAG: insulinase family protein [Planctomycetota bacterium]REK30378.1 MAG: insulinase family protein [Planctomycetota bacterium]